MRTEMIVGVLELSSKYRYGLNSRGVPLYLFRPYDDARPEYVVGCSHRDTSIDQIAIVDVPVGEPAPGPGQPRLRGSLERLLGPVGDYDTEVTALLNHYGGARRSTKLPPIPPVDDSDDADRVELSGAGGWISWHIDPPGCRDVDDAVSYHPATGVWVITIADAAAAVPCPSEVDERARQLGSTFYDLDGHVERPMLPPAISEESASLLPGSRRRGVSLFLPAAPADPYFALTWITVNHSFTYETWADSRIAWMLGVQDVVATQQQHDSLRSHVEESHAFVERLMILYNRQAADLFRRHPAAGGIVRTQAAAEAEEVSGWAAIDPALAHLANEAATYELATDEHDQSHAGLAVNAYTHITSPLRRYADLHNQRVLKAILRSTAPPTPDVTLPDHLNERTKAQRRWNRDLTFLKHVTPGIVHTIDVVWVDATRVWVPAWKRLLRIRHDPADIPAPGTRTKIEIFCDPTRRNWRQRILTAPC